MITVAIMKKQKKLKNMSGNFPGGIHRGESVIGGNFPSGNFPDYLTFIK